MKVPDELTEEEAVGVGCAFRTVVAATSGSANWVSWETWSSRAPAPSGSTPPWSPRERGPHDHRGRRPGNRLELAKRWGADYAINIEEFKTAEERSK